MDRHVLGLFANQAHPVRPQHAQLVDSLSTVRLLTSGRQSRQTKISLYLATPM